MAAIYNPTRQKLLSVVKDFHDTYFTLMEVNYPKKFITDVEKASGPFIVVEIIKSPRPLGLPYMHCVEVSGQLILSMYTRINSGSKIFDDYTDLLVEHFMGNTIDQVTYRNVTPFDSQGIPGFNGVSNSIQFEIDYFNV